MRKKFLGFLLAATMLMSCGSCGGGDVPEETAESPDGTVAVLSADGTVGYTLIRPESSAPEELAAAQDVHAAVQETLGIRLDFTTDFVKKGANPDDANPYEILIGRTNRSASAEAYEKIGEDEFILAMIDGRLCVAGYTPELTALAVEVLLDGHLTGEGLTLPRNFMEIYMAEKTYETRTFRNPVVDHGADPWVVRDGEDYYYCYSGGNGVCVNKIDALDKITEDGGKKVYTAPGGTMYSAEYWAPELHKIDGKWYIYVAADDGDNYHHRMYVLECTGDDPTDPFEMKGKITDATDKWAIDGTVLQYKGECYFVWSGWEGDENVAQNLYIAHMANPWTIDSERTKLSEPEYKFEKMGGRPWINEGPVTLVSNDTVHVIYSGSGSWSDFYCLGKLTFDGTGDILDAASWRKSDKALFEKTDDVFGPGHCSFSTAADGSTWMIYHANLVSGSGWNGRSVWVQKVAWDGDEIVLGTPAPSSTEHEMPVPTYSKTNVKLK